MSDRQLQTFFLKVAVGVAVTLCLELAALHKILSIGLIAIAAVFLFRCLALASAWQQLAQFNQQQADRHFYALTSEQEPIDREELILDTYDTALWLLPVILAIGFWLPLHWGELLHAFQN